MKRHLSIIAAIATSVVVCGAPAVQAAELAPGEMQWVLTPADLQTPSGKIRDSFTNNIGATIPNACFSVSSGASADGRKSLDTIVSNTSYRNGTMWNSSVWTYKTPAAAKASFDQLQKRSLAVCNDSRSGLIGDDVANMPAVQSQRSAALARTTVPASALPRFFVAASTIMLDPATAKPGYTDEFSYSVFSLAGDAIVQVFVSQEKPLTSAQRTDAARGTNAIAKRYLASS